jgi:hypothetical protein
MRSEEDLVVSRDERTCWRCLGYCDGGFDYLLERKIPLLLTYISFSFFVILVSRDECLHLNDILGVKTLAGCHK